MVLFPKPKTLAQTPFGHKGWLPTRLGTIGSALPCRSSAPERMTSNRLKITRSNKNGSVS